jgi:nucleoside 2-deoxyribosyltransferase
MFDYKLFNITWDNKPLALQSGGNINILANSQIGKFGATIDCLRFLDEWQESDNYRILSLIHEKTVLGKPYFLYLEREKDFVSKIKLDDYTLVLIQNILNDFPSNIIELQTRALMLLYMQFPRYGENIENTMPYDFFAEDYSDWVFILESMKNKNWIDVKISKMVNRTFMLSTPFLIAEDGWIEIEKTIENNYTKQVFVAMWFDVSMNKAFEAIEKAVTECGLYVVRIDRKEHNNEISGEILFEIKKSRIIIADVTKQRNGVYFEAGFGLGHQKTVIWSCREDDLKNIHFDTRQYNHVLWKDEDELYIRIKNRLLATLAIED